MKTSIRTSFNMNELLATIQTADAAQLTAETLTKQYCVSHELSTTPSTITQIIDVPFMKGQIVQTTHINGVDVSYEYEIEEEFVIELCSVMTRLAEWVRVFPVDALKPLLTK